MGDLKTQTKEGYVMKSVSQKKQRLRKQKQNKKKRIDLGELNG
jgi:hypothetical protein